MPVIAFLLSSRTMQTVFCFFSATAVVFLKMYLPRKSLNTAINTSHTYLGDAPYGAPLSGCSEAVGG